MGDVSRETRERLEDYVSLLVDENRRQNLIASSTVGNVWERHILDSLQLLRLAHPATNWVDVGSGAGLPGVVVAIAAPDLSVTLVESRARRVDFLSDVVRRLRLTNAVVHAGLAASLVGKFDIISARAVASLDRLFELTLHLAHDATQFVLPKGRSAQTELETANRTWQGNFRLEPSLTSDEAFIVVADHVRRRGEHDLRRNRQPKRRSR